MMVEIESIAAILADDTKISDDKLVHLISELRAAASQTAVIDFEKHKIRRVLEACARRRDLELGKSVAGFTPRRFR